MLLFTHQWVVEASRTLTGIKEEIDDALQPSFNSVVAFLIVTKKTLESH